MKRNLCNTRQESENHAELLVQGNVVGVVASCCHASSCFEKHIGAIVIKSCIVGVYSKRIRSFTRLSWVKILLVAAGSVCYPGNHICTVHACAVAEREIWSGGDVNEVLYFVTTWKVGYFDWASVFISLLTRSSWSLESVVAEVVILLLQKGAFEE
jgi:hypothetical protein